MKQPTAPPDLYPSLPMESDQTYRLHEISQLKKRLEDERDRRGQLYKKYRRGMNVLDGLNTTLITASMGIGIGGIISGPFVLGLEVVALACGVLGITGRFVGRRLEVKAKKHDEIRVLAESKLNTITDHVSSALMDGQISDEEFRLIMDEVNKYNQMKSDIRANARKAHSAVKPPVLDEETKNSLIKQGRDEARASFIKKLGAGSQ